MWRNQKQKDRTVLPKRNLIVNIGRSQKVFETDPNPKNRLEAPNLTELKTKG